MQCPLLISCDAFTMCRLVHSSHLERLVVWELTVFWISALYLLMTSSISLIDMRVDTHKFTHTHKQAHTHIHTQAHTRTIQTSHNNTGNESHVTHA